VNASVKRREFGQDLKPLCQIHDNDIPRATAEEIGAEKTA
jgi:hypothetical protein